MKRGRNTILQKVTCNNWLIVYHQHERYNIKLFRTGLLWNGRSFYKPAESHTIYEKVNPAINVLFLLSTPYIKRLTLSEKFCKPLSLKRPLSNATSQRGQCLLKIYDLQLQLVKHMKISTFTKVSLSKSGKSMPKYFLKYFILYRCSIPFDTQFLNFINFVNFLQFQNFFKRLFF